MIIPSPIILNISYNTKNFQICISRLEPLSWIPDSYIQSHACPLYLGSHKHLRYNILTPLIFTWESEWTLGVGEGQGGLACCDSWGRKESGTTELLIWSDLICAPTKQWQVIPLPNFVFQRQLTTKKDPSAYGLDYPFFLFVCLLFFFYLCIYFWLCWVFVAARGFSPVAASRDYSLGVVCGLLVWWVLLLLSIGYRV